MHQDRTGPLHGSSDTLSEDELLLELEVLPAVNRPSEDMPYTPSPPWLHVL